MIKREQALKAIIALIVLVWIFSYFFLQGYAFWSGFAGALTIPLLLTAMAADSLLKD